MITRDVNQLQVVPGFWHNAKFVTCEALGGSCTCSGGVAAAGSTWWPGFMVDRLGLTRAFNSVLVAPVVVADIASTDSAGNARARYYGIGVGLQHTSATGGTWADYSTGDWIYDQGLWSQTTATASACHTFYSAVQRDTATVLGGVMATATSTTPGLSVQAGSSSTGFAYYTGPGAAFSLGGAKRYVRVVLRPRIETAACAQGLMGMSASLIFGEPGEAPVPDTPVKRVLVTTGCAT